MAVNTVLKTKSAGDIEVRKLKGSDIPILQQFCVDCTDFHLLCQGEEPSALEGEELMQDCPPSKSPEDKVVFGLFSDRKQMLGVVEMLQDYPQPGIWYLGLFLLHPNWRGMGLGSEIIAWVEQYLTENNVSTLDLAVLDVNPRGRKFWVSRGFQLYREVANYQSGKINTTAYVMRKVI